MPPLRLLSLAFAGALLSSSLIIAQESASEPSSAPSPEPYSAPRIVDRIDESQLVTLKGNTHPSARAQFDRGAVNPELRMDGLILVLQRSPERQAAFDAFVASQSDPSSPNFHHWLEPEEIGERFGPAESDIAVIQTWLRGHGLAVGEVGKDRMTIHFGGTAAQVQDAFHTEIHNLDVNGQPHIANVSDPKIPAALAPVVVGPKALHNFQPHPLHKLGSKVRYNRQLGGWQRIQEEPAADGKRSLLPHPMFGSTNANGIEEDVTPYDFATIYNVLPSWRNGINGAGQTIAIAGTSDIAAGDVNTFRSTFGLPKIASFTQMEGDGIDPGQCAVNPSQPAFCFPSDQQENTLDVEWSGAIAPGASIVLVSSGNNSEGTIDTIFESSNFVLTKKIAPILNVSYGICELELGTGGNLAYKNLWQSLSSAGIAVFVATGDSGAASCDQGGDGGGQNLPYPAEFGLSVSGYSSTPYNTAVGGTDFNWCNPFTETCTASPHWGSGNATNGSNAVGYIPEVPWNNSCANPLLLPFFQSGASGSGITVNDAEQGCNFILDYEQESGDPEFDPLIDTIGGTGGRSTCTTNNTTASTTTSTLDPASCSGGYPKPSWQAGVPGIPNDARRDVPDVSFFASNGFMSSAYLICETPGNAACDYTSATDLVAQEIGGTSVASPAMAGVMALINQKAGAPWGNPNVELYTLGSKESYGSCSSESVSTSSSCYFNDIDSSNNSQPCATGVSPECQTIHSGDVIGTLEGWSATHGYDLSTGLGSLNVSNVVTAWPFSPVPAVSLSLAALTFPGTAEGVSSAALSITLKNSGHGSLALNASGDGIKITGTDATSFTQTNNCGASVAVGASCQIKVVFKPLAAGPLTASIGIADNAFGSPQAVTLAGTGLSPEIRLSVSTLVYSAVPVGRTSSAKTVTLRNAGNAALAIGSIAVKGTNPLSFTQTNNCGSSVAVGKSCTISVLFKPAKTGALSAYIAITDKASGSPQKITVSGSGEAPIVVLSAGSLAFPETVVGKASQSQTFTISNIGNYVLGRPTGALISITGADPASFSETNTCNNRVNAGSKCTVTVRFNPRKAGALTANITFTDNATPPTQNVKLSGTGQ